MVGAERDFRTGAGWTSWGWWGGLSPDPRAAGNQVACEFPATYTIVSAGTFFARDFGCRQPRSKGVHPDERESGASEVRYSLGKYAPGDQGRAVCRFCAVDFDGDPRRGRLASASGADGG